MQSEKFGRLLKGAISSIAAYECKTAPVIEEELGQYIGVSAASIQRYKAGHIPPEYQTVQVLADTIIKRGYLNRDWLVGFLQAAHFPAPDSLINQHFPAESASAILSNPAQPGGRVYHNLPAPTYNQFVMREQAYADVLDGLQQRSAAVVITSLGGMGKTSLAREVAARSLSGYGGAPLFEAVVWVSDKDHPGQTNLALVLDEVARTLDYPGFTQFAPPERQREVEQLLRRVKALLVVDNFETITDDTLLVWLLRIPEPSKVLITTREYRREFRRGGWPVELRGMSEAEAADLIRQRVRVLKIEKLIDGPGQLSPLVALTGGNAKAIELALGCIKYEQRPLSEVLASLAAAQGELFDDLFSHCWQLLDGAARHILLAMPLFQNGAGRAALMKVAGSSGVTFDRALERLTDLTLLDVQTTNLDAPPRYTLHPLVNSFAHANLLAQPKLEREMRLRWVNWYIDLASQVGYCWNDLLRLEKLDPEQDSIQAVLQWTLNHGYYKQTLDLTKGVGYYYYIRGLWERKPPINLMSAQAAHKLHDFVQEAESLAYLVQLLCKQGNLAEAEEFLPALRKLAETVELPDEVQFLYRHALALYALARNDPETARQIWQFTLSLAEKLSPHLLIINRQWLGTCLYRQGLLDEAKSYHAASLSEAVRFDYRQGIVTNLIGLAKIELDRGELVVASERLATARNYATRYKYRDHEAQIERLSTRLYSLEGNQEAAQQTLLAAIDLFERLGMRYELDEARQELEVLTSLPKFATAVLTKTA